MRADLRFGDCWTPIMSSSVINISPIRKRLCNRVVCVVGGVGGVRSDVNRWSS